MGAAVGMGRSPVSPSLQLSLSVTSTPQVLVSLSVTREGQIEIMVVMRVMVVAAT